jgi:hypothetical protein
MSIVIDNSRAWFNSLSAAALVRGLASGEVLYQSNTHEIEEATTHLAYLFKNRYSKEVCPFQLNKCGIWVSPSSRKVYVFTWLLMPATLSFEADDVSDNPGLMPHRIHHHRVGSKKLFDALENDYTWYVVPIAVLGTDHPGEILGEEFYEVGVAMNNEVKNLLFT